MSQNSLSSGFSSQGPIPASHQVTLGTLQGLFVVLCIWFFVSSSVFPLSTCLFFHDTFLTHILCAAAILVVWQQWERGRQEACPHRASTQSEDGAFVEQR